MKISKSLFLAFAGLGLFACSNEEFNENQPLEGVGAVSIKIEAPTMTRSSLGTSGESVKVVPQADTKVIVKLSASSGAQTIELTPEQWSKGSVVTFWNVENPTGVTVEMNGGVASYDAVNISTLQTMPAAIPVYGSTTTFTATDRNESPNLKDDHQTGANTGDDTKKYQIFTAEVQLEIPVARLEVSGIKHVEHKGADEKDECMFATLTIDGVYMDNIKPTGAGSRTDYQFVSGGNGTGGEAILKEAISAPDNDFMAASAVWPKEPENAYAFNFYAPTKEEIDAAEKVVDDEETEDIDEALAAKQALNPKFKIYFAKATGAADPVTQPRYAMITNYKDEAGNSIILKKGTVYRIIDATLLDKNIIGDEGGNTLYGVEVTVKEAQWTVETIKADWAE